MADRKDGKLSVKSLDGILDTLLVLGIQVTDRFIQNQQGRLAQKRPGQGQTLPLAPGQSHTPVTYDSLETLGKL